MPTSWFLDQLNSTTSEPVRVFTLAGSDHSDNVYKWPTIKREIENLKFNIANITMVNADGLYNEFIESLYMIPATCTLDIGFSHPTSGDELVRLYSGYVEKIAYSDQSMQFQLRDKLYKLSLKKVGSDDDPISISSENPAYIAWTLCTCYGGLDSTASDSNTDIDYDYYTSWYSEFEADDIKTYAYYEGEKIIKCIDDLCEYTDSFAWVNGDGKIVFNRFTEVSSLDFIIFEGQYKKIGIDIDLAKLTNRQYVNYNYSVTSDYWQNQYSEQNTVSVNSYSVHEKVLGKENIWYVAQAQASNIASRIVTRKANPSKDFKIDTLLYGIHREPGTNMRLVNSFYSVSSATGWVVSKQQINMDSFVTIIKTTEALSASAFYLDVSNLDGDEVLL